MSTSENDNSSFEARLQSLEQHYTLCDDEQVQRILRGEPSLVFLLLHVYPDIAAAFPDVHIFLHAVTNPEAPYMQGESVDDCQEIAAFISTSLEPSEAIQRLTAFYQSVWGQAVRATHGKIAVGLECL
ncbi:MAG TPA: hypothetical protein DHW02_14495, partial [Ktedonobacter sp.]|nr:hypothetical protein [Ktedonobacter sp.]